MALPIPFSSCSVNGTADRDRWSKWWPSSLPQDGLAKIIRQKVLEERTVVHENCKAEIEKRQRFEEGVSYKPLAEWEVKPCRGRQRKTWMKVINELLLQLDLDSQEVLAADNINLFLDTVDEALRDREYKDFNDSLNTKVKLNLYKSFCKEIEFKIICRG